MKRMAYEKLLTWKQDKNKKPLIVNGARQVGKTYLIKEFAKLEYAHHYYLNFEEDPDLCDFFKGSLNPSRILEKLAIWAGAEINPDNSLVIFDEIQACPEALNSLKYFQEEANHYHIIAAGSLLGIKLANTKGFPVGKINFLDLHPLSFFEFLEAIQKHKLKSYLENYPECTPLPEPFHQELLELLKKYFYIGGMPEAVAEYAKTENILKVREIQHAILRAYDFDFAKHAPKTEIMRIQNVWESIPNQLAKENKKFVFSAIKKSARGREFEAALQWLVEAGLILKSYNITAPKLPLPHYGDTSAFKIFALDVGLLGAMSNVPVQILLNKETLFSEFFGAFTENYIAQTLNTLQQPLYYWTSEGIAEVDFVIQHEMNIYPLEVKSGSSKGKKSLLIYNEKYKPALLLRTSTRNLKQDGSVLNIPLYLMTQFQKIIK